MTIETKEIKINKNLSIGGKNPLFLIGGPCVIESKDHSLSMAGKIKTICDEFKIPFIFKSSFDKANRSFLDSFRGPGLEQGMEILSTVKKQIGVPVLSDVHETWQVSHAAKVLDIIQIPAFLCRQTDLIVAAAKTQKPINVKKGQFLSPQDMKNVIEKIQRHNNHQILLTERGTSFGYNNLVVDIRSIPAMKMFGFPVVIDAAHSVQKPGGEGRFSGGDREFIPIIARAGVSAGADGVFLEVHDNPQEAKSDGLNSLNINDLRDLLSLLLDLREALRKAAIF